MGMRRVLSLLSAAVLMLLAVSCADDAAVMSELDAAESVMEDSPETALALLDTMQRSRLVSRKAAARHALLYSQALDKNYIDMTTDSIIRPAAEYYSRHGSADERLKAQYYLGCIYRNLGDSERAMECYVRAERYVDRAEDYKAVGRLYSAKKAVYFDLYYFDMAYRYSLLSAEYYGRSGSSELCVKALLSAVHAASMQENYFSADSILTVIENEYGKDSLSSSNLSAYYSERLILSEADGSMMEKGTVQVLLNDYLREVPLEKVEWGIVVGTYIKSGELDSAVKALEYYSLTNPEYATMPQYHLLSALVKARLGDFTEAYNLLSSYREIVRTEDIKRIKPEVKFIDERYNKEVEILRTKNIVLFIVFFSIIIISVIVGRLMIVRHRLKVQKIRESEARKDAELAEMSRNNLEEKKKCLELVNERLIIENKTLERMLAMSNITEATRKAISNRQTAITHVLSSKISGTDSNLLEYVEKLLGEVMEDKEEFILSTMMSYSVAHPKFVNYLRNQGLSEWETGYCCFYAMGLRGKEIGNLINNGSHSHHNRASIIRRKLGLGERDMNLGQYCQKLLRDLEKE